MKKLFVLSAMCIVTMLFTNKAMSQVVASGTTGACTWTLTGPSGNYTLTISGTGAMGNYGNYSGIETPWFSYWSNIKTLNLQQGVTSIGWGAFFNCIGLTSVTIPNSVTSIGNQAFSYCYGLTSVTIPNSVTSIGLQAFSYCYGLTSVTIPNSVTSIGNLAFYYCSGLTSIDVDTINPNYSSVNGILFNKLQDTLIQYPSGKIGDTIPNSVTTIGNSAFSNCIGLTSVTIPNSVTSIGRGAFSNCSGLDTVFIPNSVTSIGEDAFYGCSGLTTVNFNATNCIFLESSSAGSPFQNCSSFTTLNIGNNVETIPANAFSGCIGLTSIAIPNSVTSIGRGAFSNCSGLTSVTIPNSVTSIGEDAFYGCSGLTTVNFNATNCIFMESSSMGSSPFQNCSSFTTLNIGNNVETIPVNAFSGCSSLTSVIIGNSVTSIGDSAFSSCISLTSVTIPNSVTSIGNQAFYQCSGLTELHVKAQTPPALGDDVFYGVHDTIPVHVLCGMASTYQSASGWSSFSNYIDDILLLNLTVESNDATMGTAAILQSNTCTDNTAIIQAVPNQGYNFVQWNDGDTQNPRTITVTQDITYTAIFEINTYTVTVLANYAERGTVTGSGDYPQDSTATITATANTGYHFVEWHDGNTDNPREFTVPRDTTFTAIFDITDAIEDMAISTISIYPNPATDNIYIVLPEHVSNALFTLYDMQGKALIHREINNRDEVSVSGLAAGIYVYSVRTEKESYQGKLIINN
jgi:hypothetical protein